MKRKLVIALGSLAVLLPLGLAGWAISTYPLATKTFQHFDATMPPGLRKTWNQIFDPIAGRCTLVRPNKNTLSYGSVNRVLPKRVSTLITCVDYNKTIINFETEEEIRLVVERYPHRPLKIQILKGSPRIGSEKLNLVLELAGKEFELSAQEPTSLSVSEKVNAWNDPVYFLDLAVGTLNISTRKAISQLLETSPAVLELTTSERGKFILNNSPISIPGKSIYLLPSGVVGL